MPNTPKIRFKGFTNDWEQRKFSDCYKMSSGYAFKMSDYCDEGVGLINGESIQHGIINDDNLNHLPEYFIQQYPEFLLKENDIVVGLNRPITNGNLKIARIPRKYNDSLLYQRAGKIVYKTDCDKDFTYVLLSQEILKHTLVEAVGSDQPFISTSKLDGWKMMMPSNMEEQVKIGEYFQNLDNLITLHQHKCDNIKLLKKYMLQKMFPQNGQNVPEIRFSGFTDDWEQRKLGDIADKAVDNRGKTPSISEEGTHPLLEVASLGSGAPDYSKVTKYLSDETFKTELRAYIKEGDILFSTVGSIGLVSLMDTNENAAIAQNIVAFRANENYDSKFLYAMLSTEENQYKAQRIVMGAVQPSIKVSQLVDVKYCITKNMGEQRKLGEYFLNLDHLITLHQQKCDELKEMKKYMLQNIFPQKG